jgi:endonuclease/exonuclease/phosphatase family metal-dependent hydrolase
VALLHLDPWSEEKRLDESVWLARLVDPAERAVVLGDFNALSASDWYTPDVMARMLDEYRDDRRGPASGWRRDVSSYLAYRGFIDAALLEPDADRRPTYPTPAIADPDGCPPIRIDYVFVSPDLAARVRSCRVRREPPAPMASDHFPLEADIDV